MKIVVWVESHYAISNWYHDLESGLLAALNNKRLKADFHILDDPDPTVDRDAVIVLAGETFEWYNRMLTFTNANHIFSCVTACEYPMHSDITILTDYSQIAYKFLQYLVDAGKRRIALFGINPSSPHDYARLITYRKAIRELGLNYNEDDVFFTTGNISQCVAAFQERVHDYDAVLGANDLYAFFAMIGAQQKGVRIPEDLYVIGSGNTMISKLAKPPITSSTINLYSVGYHTISAIQIIANNASMIELNIKNEVRYFARESTACRPFSEEYKHHANIPTAIRSSDSKESAITSFNDELFMNVVNFELLFSDIDSVDYEIIKCIVENDYKTRSRIADDCYLSDTALDYRLRKLYKRFDVSSYREFYNALKMMCQYVDISRIQPKE